MNNKNTTLTEFDRFVDQVSNDLAKTTIGMGRVFDGVRTSLGNYDSYPPFNFEQHSETQYRVVFALAGFEKEDITVEVKNGNWLTIVGEKLDDENEVQPTYLHRGIANRAFKRLVQIADDVEVKDAVMNNGLLTVTLEQHIPESKQSKSIKIK